MAREKDVQIVTTEWVPGHEISEVKGLVWAASVQSKHIIEDLQAFVRTLRGGEISEYLHLVTKSRIEILHKLAANARKVNANAVIGTRIATAQIIGNTIEVLAYGTAVRVAPLAKRKK
ncbi:MAG TPA: YbjQ family protein [archaeon]|nr:YbjQ family protein [archaeon]HLD80629.1 YbjQ family protein [archaeon]